RPQPDDLRGVLRPAWGGGPGGILAAPRLVCGLRRRQRRLHPAGRGAGAGQAVRRRLPGLPAERAELDSQSEAVGGREIGGDRGKPRQDRWTSRTLPIYWSIGGPR